MTNYNLKIEFVITYNVKVINKKNRPIIYISQCIVIQEVLSNINTGK